jgi:MSHA pilin protein MshD
MCASRRGFTLMEVLVLIVVIGVALAGVLLLFQNTVRRSADPQINKQALAIAEAMLDEILLNAYDPDGVVGTRANFNDVDDYATYTTTGGMKDIQGNPIPGLQDYNVTNIAVVVTALNDSPATLTPVAEAKRITVTVSHVSGVSILLEGYRVRYAP